MNPFAFRAFFMLLIGVIWLSPHLASAKKRTILKKALILARSSFAHHYVTSGHGCRKNEVMVGIHERDHKSICAVPTGRLRVIRRKQDTRKIATQVSHSPSMHGCPDGYFIQGIWASGKYSYWCAALGDRAGKPYVYTECIHQGRDSKKTQSDIYGFLNPKMHACPIGWAMVGWHMKKNHLYCCR